MNQFRVNQFFIALEWLILWWKHLRITTIHFLLAVLGVIGPTNKWVARRVACKYMMWKIISTFSWIPIYVYFTVISLTVSTVLPWSLSVTPANGLRSEYSVIKPINKKSVKALILEVVLSLLLDPSHQCEFYLDLLFLDVFHS